MKTVGEILRRARDEKGLTLDHIEEKIKIRKKFLQALEENAWNKLPSLPYIKGFLRNYSSFLNLNADEMLAVFRRQYLFEEKDELIPESISNPVNKPIIRLSPQRIFLFVTVIFLLIFFINLARQYRAISNPPMLSVEQPNEGEILTSQDLEVRGKTDPDAVIEINNKKITINDKGEFSATFQLQPGINTIIIESVSKHGKKRTVTRTVSVENQGSQF